MEEWPAYAHMFSPLAMPTDWGIHSPLGNVAKSFFALHFKVSHFGITFEWWQYIPWMFFLYKGGVKHYPLKLNFHILTACTPILLVLLVANRVHKQHSRKSGFVASLNREKRVPQQKWLVCTLKKEEERGALAEPKKRLLCALEEEEEKNGQEVLLIYMERIAVPSTLVNKKMAAMRT